MASYLHLLKPDSAPVAASAIDASSREPGAEVTIVLLDVAAPPGLSPAVRVRHLAEGDLDYSGLLDLIFEHDHVISW